MDEWMLAIAHAVTAAVLIGFGLPLANDRIPPNPIYGIRAPKAFKSEENWYTLNRHGGLWMIRIGLGLAALAGLLAVLRPAEGSATFWAGVLLIPIAVLLLVMITFSRARRLP